MSLKQLWTSVRSQGGPRIICDLALDLGSENSRICLASETSPVFEMASCVAYDALRESVVAVGADALRMRGRERQGLTIQSPIRIGVVSQPDLTQLLIERLVAEVRGRRRLLGPRLVIAVPSSATSVQRRALLRAAESAGARRVTMVPESLAAALGAELPVLGPRGSLIVEMGAEKTTIAVISLGAVVVSSSLPIGGAQISEALINHLRRAHQLLIGERTAETLKISHGSAIGSLEARKARVRGRHLIRSLPTTVELNEQELVEPIVQVLEQLVIAIRGVLERTPPELSADLSDSGIHLSGGGSLLHGICDFLEGQIRLPTRVVDDPKTSVVRGCRLMASDRSLTDHYALNE